MDWQKSVAFFSGLELFTLKCSNEEGRVLELFLLCLEIFCFYFLTVRHILVQICVCVRLFIWGHQILCILKRVKIFPKQSLSQKENNSQLESLLVRHYTTMWECMFIWKMMGGGGEGIGGEQQEMWNVAVQCSHCGLVTVAMTKTIMTLIQWATCRCCMSNSWTWFLDKIQKMEMNEKLRLTLGKDEIIIQKH